MKKLYGTGVALVTPFTETLDVDYRSLKKLLTYTSRGADYFVVMGTTGEAATCSDDEKNEILKFIKQNNPKRLPIVYGIGGNNTQQVIDSIRSCNFDGVDAILSVSPYYNKPSQEGICQHFEIIASVCPVPVVLYNVPGRTSSNMTDETTIRLSNHANIIGIKEASGNIEQCMKIVKGAPKDFLLISGDDMWTSVLYSIGAKGVISVLANAYPTVFKKMKEHAFAGRHIKASREQFKLLEVNGPMYEEGNPVGVKFLLSGINVCGPYVRLPLVEASEMLKTKINRILETS